MNPLLISAAACALCMGTMAVMMLRMTKGMNHDHINKDSKDPVKKP